MNPEVYKECTTCKHCKETVECEGVCTHPQDAWKNSRVIGGMTVVCDEWEGKK